MYRTLGIVEVPGNASGERLLAGLATRNFGGKSLLEWVVRRMTETMLLDQVVIVAPGAGAARRIAWRTPGDVAVYVADEGLDALARLAAAVRAYDAAAAVCANVDHPFIDPALIDRLVTKAESYRLCDYMSYCSHRGVSAQLMKLGVAAEWYRASALQRADAQAQRPEERQNPAQFFRAYPEQFHIRLLPLPERLDRDDLRLAVRGEEDWDHAQIILEALGPDNLEWQQIAKLLDAHPALRQRMAALNEVECTA